MINGKPAVRADGSNSYLIITPPIVTIADDLSIFWVSKQATSSGSLIGRGTSNGDTLLGFDSSGTDHRYNYRRHGLAQTSPTMATLRDPTQFYIFGLRHSGSTVEYFKGGEIGTALASYTYTNSAFDIGYLYLV